jgi:hypothetical protein
MQIRAALEANAFHLPRSSETDKMTTLVLSSKRRMGFFRCADKVRWRTKSAGERSSSVIRSMIESGRFNGGKKSDMVGDKALGRIHRHWDNRTQPPWCVVAQASKLLASISNVSGSDCTSNAQERTGQRSVPINDGEITAVNAIQGLETLGDNHGSNWRFSRGGDSWSNISTHTSVYPLPSTCSSTACTRYTRSSRIYRKLGRNASESGTFEGAEGNG